jgi:hypothetical protein
MKSTTNLRTSTACQTTSRRPQKGKRQKEREREREKEKKREREDERKWKVKNMRCHEINEELVRDVGFFYFALLLTGAISYGNDVLHGSAALESLDACGGCIIAFGLSIAVSQTERRAWLRPMLERIY